MEREQWSNLQRYNQQPYMNQLNQVQLKSSSKYVKMNLKSPVVVQNSSGAAQGDTCVYVITQTTHRNQGTEQKLMNVTSLPNLPVPHPARINMAEQPVRTEKNISRKISSENRDNNSDARAQKFPKRLSRATRSDREFHSLHEKLNNLEELLLKMDNDVEERRREKRKIFEHQKKERLRSNERKRSHSKKDLKESLKLLVTQVSPPSHKIERMVADPYSPRHNHYYISEVVKFYKQENSMVRDHLKNSLQIFRMFEKKLLPTKEVISPKFISNPKKATHLDKKTLVLDLDETLIHCNDLIEKDKDFVIDIKFPNGDSIQAGINVRPYAVEFLHTLAKDFQIIIFTASHSFYANLVLDKLDPTNQCIHHRYYRQNCVLTSEGAYVKDLRVLNRNLADVILVDNAAYSYAFQAENGIPILPYYDGKQDFELQTLQKYLQGLAFVSDVREVNKKMFKLNRYVEFDDVDKLVPALYGEWMD